MDHNGHLRQYQDPHFNQLGGVVVWLQVRRKTIIKISIIITLLVKYQALALIKIIRFELGTWIITNQGM
jgi:hypothetical protein